MKQPYTVQLHAELVQQLDQIAAERHSDRSELLNRILADYLSAQKSDIQPLFEHISGILNRSGAFQVHTSAPEGVLFAKTGLRYAFRPELKYSVQLSSAAQPARITVMYRANDLESLQRFHQFLRLWMDIEEHYAPNPGAAAFEYGRFSRTFPLRGDVLPDTLALSIGEYIQALDETLKLFILHREVDRAQIERRYQEFLRRGFR